MYVDHESVIKMFFQHLKTYRWICIISIILEGIRIIYWLLKVSVFKYACRQIVCFCLLLHYICHIRWVCVWRIMYVFIFFFCFRFVRIFKFCIFLSKTFSLKVLLSELFIENSSKLSRLFSNIVFKVMISCPSMYIIIFTLFDPNGYLVPLTALHHLLKYNVPTDINNLKNHKLYSSKSI